MATSRRPIVLGLLWHSMNSDNLGVGALTLAHIEILDEVARTLDLAPRFLVIGWTDPKPPYVRRPDVEVVQIRMKDFLPGGALQRALRKSDLVLDIGAGDSFADIYGRARILKMLAAQASALLAGRPLVLSPQTLGPFRSPTIRRLALAVMRHARAVATRDRLSCDYARQMGYRGPVIEASDVALRLPFEPSPKRDEGAPLRVGVNVSGLLFNGGYDRRNMFGLSLDYAALMRSVVDFFRRRDDCEVHLIGHVQSSAQPVEDDRAAALLLAENRPGTVVAPAFADPVAAKSYIAGMDFFVGARMHACIAALSSGVPVLPLAYSRKFAGLFNSLGYAHGADCRADTADIVMDKIARSFEDRDRLRTDAQRALAVGLQRLSAYEAALVEILSDRASGRT